MSLSKYLIATAGLGAVAAGILWLSRDTETVKFDPKTHTLAKLLDILEDV
jgi:hypothetical protein